MYTAEGGGRGQRIFLKGPKFFIGRGEGAEDIFERTKVFHISSHHAELFDIPPLDQKKREERSSILDVKQRRF